MCSCIDENVPEENYRKIVIKPKAINREKVGRFCFAQYIKCGQVYRGRSPLCRSAEDAIPLLWVQGRSALLGSRGKALWRVKGGSPYRVKGETPCPARVGACANSYWVLSDAGTGRFGSKAALPAEGNLKRRRTE